MSSKVTIKWPSIIPQGEDNIVCCCIFYRIPISNFMEIKYVLASEYYHTQTFVYKRHYFSILEEELGLNSLPGSPTYNLMIFLHRKYNPYF